MEISYQKAWDRAGYYLLACSGFPLKSKYKLRKTGQSYTDVLRQHKIVYTLIIEQPAKISETKSDPTLGLNKAVDEIKDKEIEEPFKLMRELLTILELRAKEQKVKDTDPEDFEWEIES